MKKKYVILLLILCFALVGCGKEDHVKGSYDFKGIVTEMDNEGNRILVDDKDKGLVWVTLPDQMKIDRFEKGVEVVVWVDGGIKESYPAQAKARNVELTSDGN